MNQRMRRTSSRAVFAIIASVWATGALAAAPAGAVDSKRATDGLREALGVGTSRAVGFLGKKDGFLGNPEVRIPMPKALETVGRGLKAVGKGDMAEEFVTSMNRAAEAAVPVAKDVFLQSIRAMSFEDAAGIVRGKGHEATDYLRKNSGPRLAELFRPIVKTQMDGVGATRAFDRMMGQSAKLPFLGKQAFELDGYVTEKAMDGLFLMIAREEERIRTDPLARTTDLLKSVFGSGGGGTKLPWRRKQP